MKEIVTKAVLTKTVHDMAGIELYPTTPEIAQIVRRIVCNQWMNTEDYKVKSACGAFLQGYEDEREDAWVLVEFWLPRGHQEFVDYVNREIEKHLAEKK